MHEASKMKQHHEILVKVNAWIDKGVAPLVESLNLFEGVVTLDSCEGCNGDPAYVYFRCCSGSKDVEPERTIKFVIWLATALRSQPNPLTVEYRLRLDWLTSEEPMAELTTQRENVPTLAAKIAELSSVKSRQCDLPVT